MELQISRLSKSYASLQVLKDFSLTLREGITTILAPSGSGKTTLLRLIAGLEAPDSGRISFGSGAKKLAYLFQEDRLLPTLTVEENIQLVAATPSEGAVWLDRVGLKEWGRAFPHQLSGGMRRRVALGRALAYPAHILLLDEPFKGLDVESKQALFSLITTSDSPKIILLITHNRGEAEACGGRVLKGLGPPLRLFEEKKV